MNKLSYNEHKQNHAHNNQTIQEDINFTGTSGEYFGIWFMNRMLTMLTLGIYSPWAKVRNMQYMYGNTELAGSTFQFLADPKKMLISRIIAIILFLIYMSSDFFSPVVGLAITVTFILLYVLLGPILTVLVMSFRARYSNWHGINFRFNKNFASAYRVYFGPNLLIGLTGLCFAMAAGVNVVGEKLGLQGEGDCPAYTWYEENGNSMPLPAELKTGEYSEQCTKTIENIEHNYLISNVEALDELQLEQLQEMNENILEPESISDFMESTSSFEEVTYNQYPQLQDMLKKLGVFFGAIFILSIPYFDFLSHRFLTRHLKLGKADIEFTGQPSQYFKIYAPWLLVATLLGFFLYKTIFANNGLHGILYQFVPLALFAFIFFIPATRAYFEAKRLNLLLSNASIEGKHQLESNVPWLHYLWILWSNTIIVIFTLGLMSPWAKIRKTKFLLSHVSLYRKGSLDELLAAERENSSALAEEVGDVFDIDIPI